MSDNVYTAIAAVMARVGAIKKTASPQLRYRYLSEESLIEALRPAMIEEGLIILPGEIIDLRTETYETPNGATMNRVIVRIEYRIVHAPSGSDVTIQVTGEGADVGDKAANKAATGALKYALRQTFLVAGGDDADATPSETLARRAAPAPARRQAPAPAPAAAAPAPPDLGLPVEHLDTPVGNLPPAVWGMLANRGHEMVGIEHPNHWRNRFIQRLPDARGNYGSVEMTLREFLALMSTPSGGVPERDEVA
jgi:hypothetical protein